MTISIKRPIEILKILMEELDKLNLKGGRKRGKQTDLIEECNLMIKRLKNPDLTWWSKEWDDIEIQKILFEIVMDCQQFVDSNQ